jgi:hypothetical protein
MGGSDDLKRNRSIDMAWWNQWSHQSLCDRESRTFIHGCLVAGGHARARIRYEHLAITRVEGGGAFLSCRRDQLSEACQVERRTCASPSGEIVQRSKAACSFARSTSLAWIPMMHRSAWSGAAP